MNTAAVPPAERSRTRVVWWAEGRIWEHNTHPSCRFWGDYIGTTDGWGTGYGAPAAGEPYRVARCLIDGEEDTLRTSDIDEKE